MSQAENLARQFHAAYERLAPSFGYETRQETRQFDPESNNGRLMIAVMGEFIAGAAGYSKSYEEALQNIASLSHASWCDPHVGPCEVLEWAKEQCVCHVGIAKTALTSPAPDTGQSGSEEAASDGA